MFQGKLYKIFSEKYIYKVATILKKKQGQWNEVQIVENIHPEIYGHVIYAKDGIAFSRKDRLNEKQCCEN